MGVCAKWDRARHAGLWAAAVWVLVVAWGALAAAQDTADLEQLLGQKKPREVEVAADVAFGGYVVPSRRAELRVEVTNRGPDASFELRVEADGVSVERRVDVARGGRKVVRMEATAPNVGRWAVSVFRDGERVARTKPAVKRLRDPLMLMAFVGKRPPGMKLPRRKPDTGAAGVAPVGDAPVDAPTLEEVETQRLWDNVRVARASEASLPESVHGYAPLKALFWSNPRVDRLSAAQVDALRAWVWSGGHLVVAVDDGWRAVAASPLGPMLPATPAGVQVLRAEDDRAAMLAILGSELGRAAHSDTSQAPLPQAMPLLQGTPRPGATPGHASIQGAEPLTWTRPLGDGRVTLWRSSWERLGRTPALGAWHTWAGTERKALRPMEGWFALRLDEPKLDINPLFLMLVLVLYVLVIGPIDYAVLKRLKRLEWTVVTYTATIALFSLLAWLALATSHEHDSSRLRLASSVWYVPQASDGAPEPEALRLRWVLDGFFSTSRRKLELTAASAAQAMWVHHAAGDGMGLSLQGQRLIGSPTRLETVVPAYALLALVQSDAEFTRDAPPLSLREVPPTPSDDGASSRAAFELRNTSAITLGSCWVWDGEERSGPYTLEPGASAVTTGWVAATGDVGELTREAAGYNRVVHWAAMVGLRVTGAPDGSLQAFCSADVDRAPDIARLDAEQSVQRSVVRVVVQRAAP